MTHAPSRRTVIISALSLLPTGALAQTAPALSAQDQALVTRAVAYLQSLTSVKGRFVQTDPRGRSGGGDFYLKRPGKVRFAYDPPNDLLVVSDGNQVSVHDKRLKTFDAYALRATPLALFLAKEIRLDKGVVVSEVKRFADGFSLTARDRTKETKGQIVLVFGESPLSLREWTVIDAQGQRTRVVLSGLRPTPLDPALFVLRDPRPKGTAKS